MFKPPLSAVGSLLGMRPRKDVCQQKADAVGVIVQESKCPVAPDAQDSSVDARGVAMIKVEGLSVLLGDAATGGTAAALRGELGIKLGLGDAVQALESGIASVLLVPLGSSRLAFGTVLDTVSELHGPSVGQALPSASIGARQHLNGGTAAKAVRSLSFSVDINKTVFGGKLAGAFPASTSTSIAHDSNQAAADTHRAPILDIQVRQSVSVPTFSGCMSTNVSDRFALDPASTDVVLRGDGCLHSTAAVTQSVLDTTFVAA